MKQKITIMFILLAFSYLANADDNYDINAGKIKSETCVACHGPNGNSVTPIWPKLAGQHAGYIVKQLQNFKSGARQNIQMSPFVEPLSEQDMKDIAAYYAAQKVELGAADPKLIPLGEKIYRAGIADKGLPACISCHGPNGSGNALALFPAVSGQHAEYAKMQLMNFRDNKRTNDINKMMQIVSEKMTIDEIEAVANYMQGLH